MEQLQQESWHLELLISGFAILGLFQLKKSLESSLAGLLANFSNITQAFEGFSLMAIGVGVNIFIINLIVHLIIRGLWIGALGLRYVSGEIDYEAIPMNPRFQAYFRSNTGSFDRYIERLENFASIIFSFTFLLFFAFVSMTIAVMWYYGAQVIFIYTIGMELDAVSRYTFEEHQWYWLFNIFKWIFLGIGGLVAFDFVTLGLLRRINIRYLSAAYFHIFRFVSTITLSFLWRPLLLNFMDKRWTRLFLYSILPYISLVYLILPSISGSEYKYFPYIYPYKNFYISQSNEITNEFSYNRVFYDDQRLHQSTEENIITVFSIPSMYVRGSVLPVFVKYQALIEYGLSQDSLIQIEPISKVGMRWETRTSHMASKRTKLERKILAKFDDSTTILRRNLVKEKSTKLDSFYATRQRTREQLKENLNNEWSEIYRTNMQNTLSAIKSRIRFSIDQVEIADSLVDMRYYIHPNADEKGLLCHFPLDSLSPGSHTLTYHLYYDFPEVTGYKQKDTANFTIPFVYKGL